MNREVIIPTKIVPGGQALGELKSGKKVFLWGALPGEEVIDYDITKNKSRYLEAIATRILNNSPWRVTPKDNVYLSTSPWQIIEYSNELNLKSELVVEIFREHHIDIPTPEILTDNKDYFYRNKMEYSLYWNNETSKIELAFHERGSHRKVPIITSSIERPEIFNRARAIIDELNSRGEQARKYQSLLLRCNKNGEVSGGLYENNKPHQKFKNLTDTILGYEYSYSPNGFFQINLPVYEMALKEIKQHIITDKVLDLYAGVGTIGLSVAGGKQLTLVEVDKFAFEEMKKNCEQSIYKDESYSENKSSAELAQAKCPVAILAKSEEVLEYIEPEQTVILDPPRAGCDKKLIDKLTEIKPRTVIYLSCNPSTQARDIKLLEEVYNIKAIKVFNFFPHTPHIENLVVLERK